MKRTRLAITLGDINGIGPEVALKALLRTDIRRQIAPVLIGPYTALLEHARVLQLPSCLFTPVDDMVELEDTLPVLDTAGGEDVRPFWGVPTEVSGHHAMRALEQALDWLKAGKVEGLVTAPISKEAIYRAGYRVPGHTEFLAERTGAQEVLMMMVADALRVGLATIHHPLHRVPDVLTPELLETRLRLLHRSLREDFGHPAPRMAVLGLNPHAGEHGLLGTEEQTVILPVMKKLREEGLHLDGPFPADSYFGAHREAYDGVMAMYHDQGLAPFKTLAFDRGVNVTAGLPIVRTSPDHGTAFPLAGQGVASSRSMEEALRLAAAIVTHRRQRYHHA